MSEAEMRRTMEHKDMNSDVRMKNIDDTMMVIGNDDRLD